MSPPRYIIEIAGPGHQRDQEFPDSIPAIYMRPGFDKIGGHRVPQDRLRPRGTGFPLNAGYPAVSAHSKKGPLEIGQPSFRAEQVALGSRQRIPQRILLLRSSVDGKQRWSRSCENGKRLSHLLPP